MKKDAKDETSAWRARLYGAYVTSGQASVSGDNPDDVFASRAPWIQAIIRRHLPVDRDVEVLDLGCGHGAFLHALRNLGYSHVTGVDSSSEQVRTARRLGIGGVEHADALEDVESRDAASMDVVLTVDLLEHLRRSELMRLADGVHRILRSGGRWVIHVPNAQGLFGPGVRYGDLTHENAFTASSIRQLCRTVGFDRIEVNPNPPVIHGVLSLCRRVVWSLGVLPARMLFAAESGCTNPVLTRSILAVAYRQ